MRQTLKPDTDHSMSSKVAPLAPRIHWEEPRPSEPQVTDRSTLVAVVLALLLMLLFGFGLFGA